MIINTGLGNPPFNYAGQSGPVASFGWLQHLAGLAGHGVATYARGRFTTTLERATSARAR